MADENTKPINFEEVLGKARKIYSEGLSIEEKQVGTLLSEAEGKKLALDLFAKKQFLELQGNWAIDVKKQIWAVLIFQFVFVFCVGFNIFHFANNISMVPNMYFAVILQNLANIIALGLVVAKFLFANPNNIE